MAGAKQQQLELIAPDWPAPPNVRAFATTRAGGVSKAPFDELNLGDHVSDDSAAVTKNRELLVDASGLPEQPLWLNQVHGNTVVEHASANAGTDADASWTAASGKVCAVMTADCLPLLLCNREGTRVAAVHAGWKGLEAGVIQNALEQFSGSEVLAWFGPVISAPNYEIDQKIFDHFVQLAEGNEDAFEFSRPGHYFFNLKMLARLILMRAGVTEIFDSRLCTFDDPRFYSYRRDGKTGRIATLIWLD